jgi:hypothetical protein
MHARCTDRGWPEARPIAVMVSIGMAGGPIEVRRPLVALKITGSSREAQCLMSHVTTGFVDSQMTRGESCTAGN